MFDRLKNLFHKIAAPSVTVAVPVQESSAVLPAVPMLEPLTDEPPAKPMETAPVAEPPTQESQSASSIPATPASPKIISLAPEQKRAKAAAYARDRRERDRLEAEQLRAAMEAERLAQEAADAATAKVAAEAEARAAEKAAIAAAEALPASITTLEPLPQPSEPQDPRPKAAEPPARFSGFDLVADVAVPPIDWDAEMQVFGEYHNPLPYRDGDRLHVLFLASIDESIARNLNSEEQRAEMCAARIIPVLYQRILANDRDRLAHGGKPKDSFNPYSTTWHYPDPHQRTSS